MINLKQIPTLETKELWWTFNQSYREYLKSPFTNKGERLYKIFATAKQELKRRGEKD
jgi:hypothetical protein